MKKVFRAGEMQNQAASAAPIPGGTPLERKGPPKKVLLVGAGLAGLVAAHELLLAGHLVTVLEARDRPGGRVHTLREPFSDGLYAEAGANYIPDNHDVVLRYVSLFDLPLVSATGRGAPTRLFFIGGKWLAIQPGRPTRWPLELGPEEQGLGPHGLLARYLQPILESLGDVSAPGWPPQHLERYDHVSFSELLVQRGASAGAVALIRLGHFDLSGDGIETVSALHLLRDLAVAQNKGQAYAIRGGNDRLPQAFATRLADKIRYDSPVLSISQQQGGVRVTFQYDGGIHDLTGDHVICTIPFPVLQRVEVTPAFTPAKQRALRELASTSVTRVYLQARTRFWHALGEAVVANTDLPIMRCFEPAYGGPGPRGMLIASTAGSQARRLAALSETERLASTLAEMEKVFPGIRDQYEVGTSYCWDHDEWARGGYAWFKPGQVASLTPHLASPEGRVHFAGDHTSAWPGWMQGALESGIRAAQEVNDAP